MTSEPAPEPAHAFGGFIGPRTLVGFVRTAAPYLFDGSHPRVGELPEVPDDGARLHTLAFHPLGWWSILLHAERLAAAERPGSADVTDYFALCLAAHWGSVASYVPTDVDAKIRDALWLDQTDPGELATMRALAAQLARWDVRGFSARLVDVDAASGETGHGLHSGHDGERLAVLCGALGAHRARGEEATAVELEAEIEAELARDATDAGARRAAACRAAIPAPAAKEAAWQQIVSGTLPNAVFRAVLDGFADPDQSELLEPYQRRYFEVVGDIWRDWSSDMAQWFVANAYPVADNRSVVEATDDLIARTSPPAALRRLLIEGRDGLERALRCQERDRQAG